MDGIEESMFLGSLRRCSVASEERAGTSLRPTFSMCRVRRFSIDITSLVSWKPCSPCTAKTPVFLEVSMRCKSLFPTGFTWVLACDPDSDLIPFDREESDLGRRATKGWDGEEVEGKCQKAGK